MHFPCTIGYIFGELPYVKGVIWYDIADDGRDNKNVQHNFGVYGAGWTRKPAVDAMIAVNSLRATSTVISSTTPIRTLSGPRHQTLNLKPTIFRMRAQLTSAEFVRIMPFAALKASVATAPAVSASPFEIRPSL